MAEIECSNCGTRWDLGTATTNRCPNAKCGWLVEIYYDRADADEVARIYNEQVPVPIQSPRAGVRALLNINGFSVSFPDQGRLAAIADKLIDAERH